MIRNILCYAEESARRFPGKTAFADEETACTYDELIKSARAVGTRLGREVTPGKPVPVLMEKGVKLFMHLWESYLQAVFIFCWIRNFRQNV